jgi:uncharacterized protein (DUF2249 family)
MTPAGVGNLLPGDSKTAVSNWLKGNEPTKLISQHCPRRLGKSIAKPQQAQLTWQYLIIGTFRQKQDN